MNKLFRRTRGGQSRTLASTSDEPAETSEDATRLPATETDQQVPPAVGSISVDRAHQGDAFDVVLRLEVPTVPKLRSSSIDASCLHQGEMNDDDGSTTAAGGEAGCRGNSSPTGSDASDRDPGATSGSAIGASSSLLRVDLPNFFRRRSLDVPRLCIHCVHLEALAGSRGDDSPGSSAPLSPAAAGGDAAGPDSRCSSPSDADLTSDDDEEDLVSGDCVTPAFDVAPWRADDQHKFYLTSPDSQTMFPVVATPADGDADDRASSGAGSNRSSVGSGDGAAAPAADWKEIVTLQVPLIKPRSSSLDVTYYASTLRPPVPADADDERRCSCENLALPDAAKHRSTSVDVNLPTDASGGSYRAITCYATDSNK